MIKSNFHTHSVYCDGCDSIESIVKRAIEKDFKYLGFSSHSYIKGDDSWTLNESNFNNYVTEVLKVKEKYKDKITILLGIEQDMRSNLYDYKFDYVIGSMHSVKKDGKYYPVDLDVSSFKYLLESVYSNDFDALCKDYYNQIKEVAVKTNANIIGHIDLITKYVEKLDISIPTNYLKYVEDAIKEIIKSAKIFEINTGAIARGYRSEPYPSKDILKIIFDYGGQIMINSDCHNKDYLDCGYDIAVNVAKEVGFKKHVIITDLGIDLVDL